jgi:hypothetical protein
MLLIQNRNFDAITTHHDRWMEPQSYVEADTEWIFQRFYDFDPDELLTFNMVTLKRVNRGNWSQKVVASRLRPLLQDELVTAVSEAGFEGLITYGDMSGTDFDPETSGNLVLFSRLQS